MANSLRAKIKKLLHDGKISQSDFDDLIKKLDGHDKILIDKWYSAGYDCGYFNGYDDGFESANDRDEDYIEERDDEWYDDEDALNDEYYLNLCESAWEAGEDSEAESGTNSEIYWTADPSYITTGG